MLNGNEVEIGQLDAGPDEIVRFHDRREVLVEDSRLKRSVNRSIYQQESQFDLVERFAADEREIGDHRRVEQWCSECLEKVAAG